MKRTEVLWCRNAPELSGARGPEVDVASGGVGGNNELTHAYQLTQYKRHSHAPLPANDVNETTTWVTWSAAATTTTTHDNGKNSDLQLSVDSLALAANVPLIKSPAWGVREPEFVPFVSALFSPNALSLSLSISPERRMNTQLHFNQLKRAENNHHHDEK